MIKYPPIQISLFLLITGITVFSSCTDNSKAEITTPRDTTITIENSYSQFFIDNTALDNFINTEVTSDSIANYMRNFYNSRNYSSAWFDEEGLTLQAQGFWNAHDKVIKQQTDSTIFDKQLHIVIDTLLADSSYILPQNEMSLTELRFTKHFFQYVQYAYTGKVDPENVQWHIPRRKLKPLDLLDSHINSKTGEWKPISRQYQLLQQALLKYREIEQRGGWPEIKDTKSKFKKGDKDQIISQLKKRLQSSGVYDITDTTTVYSDSLTSAIKKSEASFGLKEDGIIDAVLIKQLNVPVEERIKQMLINLERMKWMPDQPANYLLANIPEYRLHVIENNKEALGMNVVVGKSANRTVIFSDELKYIVFSPYWNIPRSIVRNEIFPAMRRSKNYLSRNNMEVTGYSGGLPIVRQKPGKSNALGRVKFIFPNSYNIYFHDTPSRSLFSSEQRAFSHGCIRLHQPFQLAEYLLRDQPEWTSEKILEAMKRSTEKWVTLSKSLPVFITYFTAWVDENSLLHFAEDIYDHDKKLADHLFQDH
jgi:murein L,D-transpeptidase YcbB/YkuD